MSAPYDRPPTGAVSVYIARRVLADMAVEANPYVPKAVRDGARNRIRGWAEAGMFHADGQVRGTCAAAAAALAATGDTSRVEVQALGALLAESLHPGTGDTSGSTA